MRTGRTDDLSGAWFVVRSFQTFIDRPSQWYPRHSGRLTELVTPLKLGEQARKKICAEKDWRILARGYERIYEASIQRRRLH
jgi:hypothetical protein